MKIFKRLFVSLSLVCACLFVTPVAVSAQCAMCSLNAENSTQHGNTQGKGLNNGILFLLSMPFLIGSGVAILWYTKFRKKEEKSPLL